MAQKILPTPRDIKTFINRVGVLYRMWNNEIPLHHLALYATIEKNGCIDLDRLRNHDLAPIKSVPVDFTDSDCFDSLAAVYFNVPVSRARQVLLGPPLAHAVENRNSQELVNLSQLTGFGELLEEFVETNLNDWPAESPQILPWLALNLKPCKIDNDDSRSRVGDLLLRGAREVASWSILDGEVGEGIAELIQMDSSQEFAKHILESLSNTDVSDSDRFLQGRTSRKAERWLSGCLKVLDAITGKIGLEILDENFRCSGRPSEYIQIVSYALGITWTPIFSKFRPRVGPSEILNVVADWVSKKKFDEPAANVVHFLRRVDEDWPWDKLVNALFERSHAQQLMPIEESRYVLSALLEFVTIVPKTSDSIRTLAVSGDCFHHGMPHSMQRIHKSRRFVYLYY